MSVEAVTQDETAAAGTAAASPAAEAPQVTEPVAAPSPAEQDSTGESGDTPPDQPVVESPKPKRGRPKATPSTAKKTRTVELTLTVTGTADGEWQAELKNGSKWVAKGLEIPAAAVSRAAKELHEDLSGPIDEVINAARAAQAAKVAQLEAELEAAKAALAELDV
ncbi:hypothetical protein ATK36_3878 [Amycolatopsis sulphurea]|uniref:Mucin n=1 Tax=Amycolatopsis sulphurea TaxID=76022 RepID=A0A2A9FEA9_9PSEU|nr:DUF6319 family protein [Amycolatopsis sulphurea]PFG48769.1 hypothetical protein ATK36_3878 [Amycolatopsis sulphurea]